ncbi:PBPRA1643 family SWIM/SEC-C metal-binding motif protein [Echinimonas agarilytica]|uniref:SEC-C metal-binding domain-containing protein n=1 Tax=Echinimonas agarilytica TaxID=1215918 RepID=A0AA41W7V3_9GAMM|nr:PBPRA1643 family SWIM/SEC-C metal-binding motif protein [Echinimonas agarilytica]MCM2679964.1 SEC-C metal-binding domain-containing protein [Echinimonas agarilytica]
MSKFFFKGRIDARQNYERYGYEPKRNVKLGTEENPIKVTVKTEARQQEIQVIVAEHKLVASISIDSEKDEDLIELNAVLNKPKTTVFEKTPQRNDPCSCGSGKKYKKCCG